MKSPLAHFLFILLPTLILTELACPTGYTLINQGKCLKLFTTSADHWTATKTCTSSGGTLATVKNAIDNRAVSTIAASAGVSKIWLGLFCFRRAHQNDTCYHDDSSGVVSYSNFAPGTLVADDMCVSMTTSGPSAGQWSSEECDRASLAYVCEVPVTVADPTCKHNFNGYCYLPSHEISGSPESTTFSKAQGICKSNNANLASIHSKQEVDFIKSIYGTDMYDAVTIGAQALQPHTFTWLDGSSFDFDFHNPFDNFTGNCLQMVTTLEQFDYIYKDIIGMWNEANGQLNNPFLCKRKIGGSTELKPLTAHNLPIHYDLSDPSNCNTTLLMAPGVITSFGYGTVPVPAAWCNYKVATVGAYQLALHFTDVSIWYNLYVDGPKEQFTVSMPGSFVMQGNTATVGHLSTRDPLGFRAVIMPH